MIIYGGEDFGKWQDHEGGALVNGVGAFTRGKLVHSFYQMRIQGEVSSLQSRRGLSAQFSSLQSLSHVQLFVTSWTAAHQASLSITNSRNPPKLMSIESVMPSNHLILYCPLLLLPSIFPSTRVFSNESALRIEWPKYWSFSFNISHTNEHPGLISILFTLSNSCFTVTMATRIVGNCCIIVK